MKEIRENNKDGRSARTEIEQMYKKMRDDLGLNELSSIVDRGEEVETNKKDEGRIIDTTDLNNKLEMLLKDKKV
jgi:hypothetical protein